MTPKEAWRIGRKVASVMRASVLPAGGAPELLAAIKGALDVPLEGKWPDVVAAYEQHSKDVFRLRDTSCPHCGLKGNSTMCGGCGRGYSL